MKYTLFITLVIASLLSSCSQCDREEQLCDYKARELVTMEVVDIRTTDGQEVDILVEFNKSIFAAEVQSLGDLRNQKTDSSYVERNRIVIGNKYQCEVTEPVDINCAEPILSFNNEFK